VSEEDDPLTGTLVADRYRVGRKLGEGGMGLVYAAVHEALHKPVALKVLSATGKIDPETVARFEREAITTANLKHPNIAEATDFGRLPDGRLFLVMEYVEGTTLRHVLADEGKLAPPRALSILQQIGEALSTAHARDVIHRDLKPENVIVSRMTASGANAATTEVAKVIDFGIAKLRNAAFGQGKTGLTRAGTVLGTPEYMAPEQVMGQPVDARADQYALAVLAFELLTGKPPYKSDDVNQLLMMHVGAPVPSTREHTPGLPAEVDVVTAKMLAKLPDERFTSVAEAMEAFTTALSTPIASTEPAPEPPKTVPLPTPVDTTLQSAQAPATAEDAPTHRRTFIAVGVVAAMMLVGGVIAMVLWSRSSSGPSVMPVELTTALVDWRNGKFEASSAVIGRSVTEAPALAELEEVAKPLAAPIADDSARAALAKLFEATPLANSHAMATALAETAVAEESKARDAALGLLRARHDLLSTEQRARVRLRDAETCDALQAAKAQAAEVATAPTQRDLERLAKGDCKVMLRTNHLCDACSAPSPEKIVERPVQKVTVRPGAPAGPAVAPVVAPAPAPPPTAAPVVPVAPGGPGKGHGQGKGKK
jgi:serine/threonine-protein kinase